MTVKKLEFFVNGALCVVIRRDILLEGLEAADYNLDNPFNWQGYVGITVATSERWSPRLDGSVQRKDFFKVVPRGITFDQESLHIHLNSKDHDYPRWIGWDSDRSNYWHVDCGEAITHTIALALALTK